MFISNGIVYGSSSPLPIKVEQVKVLPDRMMLIFTSDPELISIGVNYLRAVCASYMFWSITEILMRYYGKLLLRVRKNSLFFFSLTRNFRHTVAQSTNILSAAQTFPLEMQLGNALALR